MTPTEQDNELREELERLFVSLEAYRLEDTGSELDMYRVTKIQFSRMKDDLAQLITADRKRVELEARINERQMLSFHRAYGRDYQATLETLEEANDKRIAELKAQQEEV